VSGSKKWRERSLTCTNKTAIYSQWNWGWTFQGVNINNCQIGFDLRTGGLTQDTQTTGSEVIIDAQITNTPVGVRSSVASGGSLKGSLLLNNVKLTNVPTAVGVADGSTVLAGGTKTIAHWGQGNVYTGTSSTGKFVQADLTAPTKDSSLLDSSGKIFGKSHPQYSNYDVSQFISIKSLGAKGDGSTVKKSFVSFTRTTGGLTGAPHCP
jgi:glucan 1,3-beta-glucosidase